MPVRCRETLPGLLKALFLLSGCLSVEAHRTMYRNWVAMRCFGTVFHSPGWPSSDDYDMVVDKVHILQLEEWRGTSEHLLFSVLSLTYILFVSVEHLHMVLL